MLLVKGIHILPTGGAETGLKRETEIEPNLGSLAFKAKGTLPDRDSLLSFCSERDIKRKGSLSCRIRQRLSFVSIIRKFTK